MSLDHSPARQKNRAPSPFGYELLTRQELAARLHVTATTVTRKYRKWGLRPLRLGGRLLFSIDHITDLEARAMRGEITL